jgi:hypothetical protein
VREFNLGLTLLVLGAIPVPVGLLGYAIWEAQGASV